MRRVMVLILLGFFAFGLVYADQKHNMTQEGLVEPEATAADEDVGICPVMGQKARKEYSYTYQGTTYYFCCPGCIEQFRNDPQKYISRIKEIKIEAFRFGYEPKVIRVKKGDIVRLLATSRDVDHGIYIKGYNINYVVSRSKVTKIEFLADRTGSFPISCSVFCGKNHRKQRAKLIVTR